ncbi:MAG TPA: peptidylprolyl isomerase [Pyrinomonadaceae bacterium]|nr:peptidylprolyl isomerase [Pyrinomonadaceae bacterium]
MSSLTKGLILLLVILGIGAGLVFWKNNTAHGSASFNTISKEEIELLLTDVAKTNPMALKRLAEDEEMKKQQLESLKQLMALASEAQREGLTNEKNNKAELENIREEVIAVNYDREMNKDKGPMPPLGFIGEDRVKQFWGEGEHQPVGWWASVKEKLGFGRRQHELEFEKFLETKLAMLAEQNPKMKDRKLTDEERQQARDFYAKLAIYNEEYEDKLAKGEIPKELQDKIGLQTKLQQAQFLARIYSAKMAERLKVSDEEVAKYIADHPELGTAEKRAKAEEVLNRAKAGEDFAKLANEFSEDPGNKDPKGELQGGFYGNNTKGKMVPAFEEAALALEPGQITQNLVETDYGYHIIKLEKKGVSEDPNLKGQETYDVRHILISTGVKDPESPFGGEKPVKLFVRQKLENEKEKAALEAIIARNNITVAEVFDIPQVSDEQIQEMMKNQQRGSELGGDDGPPPPPPAKQPAKDK